MKFWNLKQNSSCDELELRDIEFDITLAGALMDALAGSNTITDADGLNMTSTNGDGTSSLIGGRKWKTVRITNCWGSGNVVNDILMACCSGYRQPIEALEFRSPTMTHLMTMGEADDGQDPPRPQQSSKNANVHTFYALNFALCYNRHLLHLTLQIETIDEGAADILARAVARNTWLETLNLGGSVISKNAIYPLSFGLRINRTLKSFGVDGCHIQDSEIATLLQSFLDHPTLENLSLQKNACHTQGMGVIANLLHYNTALRTLDMSYLIRKRKDPSTTTAAQQNNPTEASESKEDTETTGMNTEQGASTDTQANPPDGDDSNRQTSQNEGNSQAPNNENVEEKRTNSEEPEADDPNQVRNTTLRSFQLAGNALDDAFLSSLLRIFGRDSALEELNLLGNRITDRGISALSQALPKMKHLKILWLGLNRFGPWGASKLVESIERNFTLQSVNIRSFDNPFDDYQERIDYFTNLNKYGRQILGNASTKGAIPLSLWPLVMQRANRLDVDEGDHAGNPFAPDLLYFLLHGPVLFENPNISRR